MFKKEGVTYEFHHMGYVATESHPDESYSKKFDIWTRDVKDSRINAQFHRYGPNHSFHPLMAEQPHIAFKVNDIEKALEGEEVIMALYEPIPGYKAAMINDAGLPVEFVETAYSYEELLELAAKGKSVVRDVNE